MSSRSWFRASRASRASSCRRTSPASPTFSWTSVVPAAAPSPWDWRRVADLSSAAEETLATGDVVAFASLVDGLKATGYGQEALLELPPGMAGPGRRLRPVPAGRVLPRLLLVVAVSAPGPSLHFLRARGGCSGFPRPGNGVRGPDGQLRQGCERAASRHHRARHLHQRAPHRHGDRRLAVRFRQGRLRCGGPGTRAATRLAAGLQCAVAPRLRQRRHHHLAIQGEPAHPAPGRCTRGEAAHHPERHRCRAPRRPDAGHAEPAADSPDDRTDRADQGHPDVPDGRCPAQGDGARCDRRGDRPGGRGSGIRVGVPPARDPARYRVRTSASSAGFPMSSSTSSPPM